MNPTLNLACTASGIANIAMAAALVTAAVVIANQRRRLCHQADAASAQTVDYQATAAADQRTINAVKDERDEALTELGHILRESDDMQADNERLVAENTVVRRENVDLRDQIDRLNAMAIEVES